ncbi:MAG: prepilin-type N-terminal cleavage/methylation domain-containing protein [Sedimentisphaerales bacterium]|nr:prepilin-type N-terminal cleavage/methylation domain-containing protein [Sedimentisphaerales bacterium]
MRSANMRLLNDRIAAECKTTSAAFTFVEVLAALAIVSISLLGLLRLHLISIKMADSAQATSRAVLLARGKIAETLALGYPEIGVEAGVVEDDTLELRWRTEVSDFQLPELVEAGLTGLREISVDVAWNQGVGRKHLQMSTCVADGRLR